MSAILYGLQCSYRGFHDQDGRSWTVEGRSWDPWQQGSWGQHGAHLGPTGPRWAPCWPVNFAIWDPLTFMMRISMLVKLAFIIYIYMYITGDIIIQQLIDQRQHHPGIFSMLPNKFMVRSQDLTKSRRRSIVVLGHFISLWNLIAISVALSNFKAIWTL